MTKKIIGISGSIKTGSVNTRILEYFMQHADDRHSFELYSGIDGLPHFNPDHDHERSPERVVLFREKLKQADGFIISTPEFAKGVPGVLKNALDWLVSSGEFVYKPVVTISASPLITAGQDAHESLLKTLRMISADIPEGGSLSIPLVRAKLDAAGQITDEQLTGELGRLWNVLCEAIDHPVERFKE